MKILILFLIMLPPFLLDGQNNQTIATKITLDEVMAKIPGKNGERYALGASHGSMRLLTYAPRGKDDQKPHTQDEIYIVVKGKGEFISGSEKVKFKANDALFVPAGQVHYFENFSKDLMVWVVFWGKEGGE